MRLRQGRGGGRPQVGTPKEGTRPSPRPRLRWPSPSEKLIMLGHPRGLIGRIRRWCPPSRCSPGVVPRRPLAADVRLRAPLRRPNCVAPAVPKPTAALRILHLALSRPSGPSSCLISPWSPFHTSGFPAKTLYSLLSGRKRPLSHLALCNVFYFSRYVSHNLHKAASVRW